MPRINRQVASLIMLAALDFKTGNRTSASKHLQKAAENEDFDETIEGLQEVTDEKTDPFTNPELAEGDDDLDLDLNGLEDLLNQTEAEQASLARTAKQNGRRQTAAEDDKIGGNNGPAGAETENNSDEEIRQEAQVARLARTRANLVALANVR